MFVIPFFFRRTLSQDFLRYDLATDHINVYNGIQSQELEPESSEDDSTEEESDILSSFVTVDEIGAID